MDVDAATKLAMEWVSENSVLLIVLACTLVLYVVFFQQSEEEKRASMYRKCKKALMELINTKNCNPILVRLAWHDSGTYAKSAGGFPVCGGANGSIRFPKELGHGANAGLSKAVNYLRAIKNDFPKISWADIIQMASACAIEHAGGPVIKMKYGRVDTEVPEQCPQEGNLPDANGFGGSEGAAQHLRNVFHRMGFNDQEIVALSGAHTLGRAFNDRSGVCPEKSGKGNEFTSSKCVARFDGHPGVGMTGGRAWTENWLTFDNSYFKRLIRVQENNKSLLWVETDQCLIDDSKFTIWYQRYAQDNKLFFDHYAKAHKKLSELGSKFDPPAGFCI